MTPLVASEIKQMEKACQLAGQLLKYLGSLVRPGVTTEELDKIAYDWILSHEAKPAPLGYHGFPKSICTSVNEVICHGVPGSQRLEVGDIVNIDVTCIKDGFYGDTSSTYFVGEVSDQAKKITQCAEECMYQGIDEVKPFATTGDIGYAVNQLARKRGYFTVRDIGGHGIGKVFHDEPFVPSYGKKGRGIRLKPWCCITVEPMINQTSAPIREFAIPHSTIKYYQTGDKSLSAQFEHTVLITDKGHEILTLID
ncbi:MAG: type I methionyl aminopeptidase [Bdellovibrionales bacterium]|nr:type I methionyl aminopeptidase [Bdellovibrionales bacterium]